MTPVRACGLDDAARPREIVGKVVHVRRRDLQAQLAVGDEARQVAERLDAALRAGERRYAGLLEGGATERSVGLAEPGRDDRLGGGADHGQQRLRRAQCGEPQGRAVEQQHAVVLGIGEERFECLREALLVGIADDVDRIGVRPGGWQKGIEPLSRLRRERGEAHCAALHAVRGPVGGDHAGTAAVGEDRQARPARQPSGRERLRRGEQLVVLVDADRADAPQRAVEHRIVADERAGVTHRSASSR